MFEILLHLSLNEIYKGMPCFLQGDSDFHSKLHNFYSKKKISLSVNIGTSRVNCIHRKHRQGFQQRRLLLNFILTEKVENIMFSDLNDWNALDTPTIT